MPTFLADRKFNWLVNRAQASLCSAIAFCHCHRDRRALTEACVHDPWQDPKTYTCTYTDTDKVSPVENTELESLRVGPDLNAVKSAN